MKKRNFYGFKYNRGQNRIEITLRDGSESKIETWKFDVNDKNKARTVFRILKEKYGVNFLPEISPEESINRDLNWLRKEKDPFE